jgi:hypothetical protein
MATAIEPRPLADLEMDSLVAVEAVRESRARGVRPWTNQEYLDAIDAVHARYNLRRTWLRIHEQETTS